MCIFEEFTVEEDQMYAELDLILEDVDLDTPILKEDLSVFINLEGA